jgi:deoxyribonuclease V
MAYHSPHPWDLTPTQAIAIQRELAGQVSAEALTKPPRYLAGVDCAFDKANNLCIAAAVLWDMQNNTVCDQHVVHQPISFPYIPGLLSFREAPAMLAALAGLNVRPDVILTDGQGLAHPRRFGIACHLGIITEIPAIGCAKSLLIGDFQSPGVSRGATADLTHKQERIGKVVRTRSRVKPLFISIGHRIDLESAVALVLECCRGFRLPEPTRQADKLVARMKGLS